MDEYDHSATEWISILKLASKMISNTIENMKGKTIIKQFQLLDIVYLQLIL